MSCMQVETHDFFNALSFYSVDDLLNNHSSQQIARYYHDLFVAFAQYIFEVHQLRKQFGLPKWSQHDDMQIATPHDLGSMKVEEAVEWYSKLIKLYYGCLEEILTLRKLYNERKGPNKYPLDDLIIQMQKLSNIIFFEVEKIIDRRWDDVSNSYEYKLKFFGFDSSENDWVTSAKGMADLRKTHPDFVEKYDRDHPEPLKENNRNIAKNQKRSK